MGVTPTPLERYFDRRGVTMIEPLPGQRVPLCFSDPQAEHLATRRAAGLFDFSFMACIAIKGADSIALLDCIQTRAIRQLPIGRIRYTLLLRTDGTVLNDATVWRIADDEFLLFIGRRDDVSIVLEQASGLDVRLDDRSTRTAVIALQGPRAGEILRACMPLPSDLAYYAIAHARCGGCRLLVARLGYSGELGYELVLDIDHAPDVWKTLLSAGAPYGLAECGFTAIDTLRIEAGHILFPNELAIRVTPPELGLARLVDAYRTPSAATLALARLRFREPQQRLVGLWLDAPATPARAPADGTDGAILTSACRSPLFGRWLGLGFVPYAQRYPGTRVRVGATRATVARLPFYDPGKSRPKH